METGFAPSPRINEPGREGGLVRRDKVGLVQPVVLSFLRWRPVSSNTPLKLVSAILLDSLLLPLSISGGGGPF